MYSDSEVTSTIYPPFSLQYNLASAKVARLSSANKYHFPFAIFFHGKGQEQFATIDKNTESY